MREKGVLPYSEIQCIVPICEQNSVLKKFESFMNINLVVKSKFCKIAVIYKPKFLNMKKDQINRKEMYDSVVAYLDSNAEKWSAIPKVGRFKNQFTAINAQIEQAQENQQTAQVFVGKNKKQLKSTVAYKADILNDSLEVLAMLTGDTELESKMSSSYSELNRLRNADFMVAIKAIVTAVEAHAEVLKTEYGVTDEQIEGLKLDFDDFLAINGQPRAYKIASVQATKSLEQLFTDATEILETRLDKVMTIFKRRDINFYNGYLAARVIVDN